MSVTIKYMGLADSPVLNAGEGRFASGPKAVGEGANILTPAGMYQDAANHNNLELKAARQERVLEEAAGRIAALALSISRLHVPESDTVSRAKTAVSSQPESLSAQADEFATSPADYSLQVAWPTRGAEINSTRENPVEGVSLTGTHTFKLTVGSTEYDLSVEVESGDTQEDLLRRLALAIGGQDSRVDATVEWGEEDAYDSAPRSRPMDRFVQLVVTSSEAGSGSRILLEDDSGSIISTYGLNQGQGPRTAFLKLGGAWRQQSTDAVSLDGGHVSGQALAATRGTAEITVSAGEGVITEELTGLVNQYNSLVSFLDANASLLRPSLKDRIIRPLEEQAAALKGLGITASATGRMTLEAAFPETVRSNFSTVREQLVGDGAWAEKLSKKLGEIMAMDIGDFAAELDYDQPLSQRKRIEALMMAVTGQIISGYY